MTYFTVLFAGYAQINAGIITSIWCVNPFFVATADYCIYGTRLKATQFAGISFIVVCVLLLSLKDVIDPPIEA